MKNGSVPDSAARSRRILRTSVVGIAANVLLAAFKAMVGFAANSVAVMLDAVNTLADALSSVLTGLDLQVEQQELVTLIWIKLQMQTSSSLV